MKIFIFDEYEDDLREIKEHVMLLADQVDACFDFNSAVHHLSTHYSDIVILNLNVISRLKELNIPLHAMTIIAIADSPEPEYLRLCMSINAVDLLIKPIQFQDIKAAINKSKHLIAGGLIENRPTSPLPNKAAKIITCFSFLELSGQSFLADNLPIYFAGQGYQTLLIDFNGHKNTIPFLPKNQNKNEHDDVLYQQIFGMDILIPGEPENLYEDRIFSIITKMKKNYDYIFLDTHKKIEGATLMSLNLSDIIIYLISPDRVFLQKIEDYFNQLKTFNISEENIIIVINEDENLPTLSKKEIEDTLKQKINFFIPKDDVLIGQAATQAQPFITSFPDVPLSQKIKSIAEFIRNSVHQSIPTGETL